ncbi:MAG TPA: glycosyltransferase [Thiotrichales bacterium]|nr:glycosyltransferase [Thiotrichales bacterium]
MQGAQTESRFRGIGRYTISFAQAIVRNRGEHEVVLALSGLFPDTIEPIRDAFEGLLPLENIRAWYAPGPVLEGEPGNEKRREVAELIREAFLASLQPDVIHITSLFEGYVDNAVTSIGRFDKSTPVSVTLHDLIPLLSSDKYLAPNPKYSSYYYGKLEDLRKASLYLAISESSKSEAIQCLNMDKGKVVNTYEGVEDLFCIEKVNENQKAALFNNLGIKGDFVLYTGGADERKNLPRLIEAYSMLPSEARQAYQLVFAGKMPQGDIERFKYIASELKLKKDDLIFTSYITDQQLVQLYNLCTLYVFPSWHEGFGLPALEAMACGAPVIGANTTSLPEVIGLEEALFDPFDVNAMSKKMLSVLVDQEKRERLKSHAKQQVKKFSWGKTAQCAISVWSQKLQNHQTRSWSAWKKSSEKQFEFLVSQIGVIASHEQDEYIRSLALCLNQNQSTLEDYWRPRQLPIILKWRLEGPFDSSYSLAILNRELAIALHQLGHDVALHSTEGPGDFEPSQEFLKVNPLLEDLNKHSKTISSLEVDVCSRNLYPPRVSGMEAPFNLMHSYGWEESGFPSEWVEQFNDYLQGITVMSDHCKKVFIDNGVAIPIVTSGVGVDHWQRVKSDKTFLIRAKKFRFLHVSSCFPRKGADVMLKAYGMSFTSEDDVTLIIKTFPNPHNEIHKWLAEARAEFEYYPDVLLIEDDLSDSQLKSLYEQSHALLAPSRAEGFGLPMAEAMLSGLAVITTGWSGQTDFCREENSWLIDYDFEWAKTHFNLYSSVWANPKVTDMARLMREVVSLTIEERTHRIEAGQKLLLEKFKWTDVASRNVEFVRNLSSSNTHEQPRIAWISTWNTRCGIAEYSAHLVSNIKSHIHVLATQTFETIRVDSDNVIRCWEMNNQDDLSTLAEKLNELQLNTIVIQFNYGFFNLEKLSEFLEKQISLQRVVIITLHSTIDPKHDATKKLSIIIPALKKVARVLVHTPADLNRLKKYGLVDNVALFPHGIIDYKASQSPKMEQNKHITIASYGFFLPHKGLLELIESISILRKKGYNIHLKMVNAEFPASQSVAEINSSKKLINKLNIGNFIELHSDFLSDKDSLALLENAQLVIFPYQETGESSSAAVRFGIVAERDVAITPLAIFDDVSRVAYRLPGCSPEAIADGIENWIEASQANSEEILSMRKRADEWRKQHRYSLIGKRFDSMIKALLHV